MKVLIGCEFSGIVRNAFLSLGFDAVSCDILPSESEGPHYQGDIRDIIHEGWDLAIFHPPCTYLANSGVRWLHTKPGRWKQMKDAALFFRELLLAPIPRVAVENPVMHRYAREIVGRGPDFTVQPWQHGHGECKRTCFWTRGLPPLVPSSIVDGREQRMWKLPPSANRWKARSTTYPGIAAAMARQWGALLREAA